jgi:hypothetical protein
MGKKKVILLICCFNILLSCNNKEFKTDSFYFSRQNKTIEIVIDKNFNLMFFDSTNLDSSYYIDLLYRHETIKYLQHNLVSKYIYPKEIENLNDITNEKIRCENLSKNHMVLKVLMCGIYNLNDRHVYCSGAVIKPPGNYIEYIGSYIDYTDTTEIRLITSCSDFLLDTAIIKKAHFDFLKNVNIIKGRVTTK